MTAVLVNGLRAISTRFVFPYKGAWFADIDVDADVVATVPVSGPATVVVGAPPGQVATLLGVFDPIASGTFSSLARVRVVGGHNLGWSKLVPAQHFAALTGLTTAAVYQATAGVVGETVVDEAPAPLPQNFVRAAGPASQVFGDAPWWVDPATGNTFVGPRPPAVPDASMQLLTWDPLTQRGELVCDTLVLPGTPIADPRLGALPVTVRDVEQTFDEHGSRVVVWCASGAISRLTAGLTTLVRALGRTQYLRPYRLRYAIAGPDVNHMGLQAVNRAPTGQPAPLPDLVPGEVWAGMPGDSCVPQPSTEVLCDFEDGDPSRPRVRGFQPGVLPIKRTIDAVAELDVGPTAAQVLLAGGAQAVALAPGVLTMNGAMKIFAQALQVAIMGVGGTLDTTLFLAALQTAAGQTPAAKVRGT